MIDWLRHWWRERVLNSAPARLWSVSFCGGKIIISDGMGGGGELSIAELRRVVVATDDSGPSDIDVMFLLYSDGPELLGVFPIEAGGSTDFVKWLASQPGFRDRECSKAMASTRVARFEIYTHDLNSG